MKSKVSMSHQARHPGPRSRNLHTQLKPRPALPLLKRRSVIGNLLRRILLACVFACVPMTSLAEAPSRAEMEKFAKLVWSGKPEKLNAFLASHPGFDVNTPLSDVANQSAAFPIVHNGRVAGLTWLLANGLDVNQRESSGATLLYIASGSPKQKDSLTIARLLLETGADHSLALTDGPTPFMRAAMFGRIDLMELLLSHGADPLALTSGGASAIDALDWSCSQGTLISLKKTGQCAPVRAILDAQGVKPSAPFRESQIALANAQVIAVENQKIIDEKAKEFSDGIDRVTGAIFAKAKGTGRRCFHQLMIGNFTGSDLNMSLSLQLDDGRWTEVTDSQDGRFTVSNSRSHPIWLVQGGTYMLGAQSSRGGSWFDGIKFDIAADCKDGDRDVTLRQFIVENDNQTSRLSMFEDFDRDGRRDTVSETDKSATPAVPDACSGLVPLATELSADSTRLMFADDQLDQMLASAGCALPDQIRNQRKKLGDLLQRSQP